LNRLAAGSEFPGSFQLVTVAPLAFSSREMVPPSSAPPPPIAIAVAEDHPVVLDGLAGLLEREGGFRVAGRAANAAGLRELVAQRPPQVLVMDLMLGLEDGLALLKDFAVAAPAMRIVVFSLQSEEIYAERCLRAGAHGYVMKTAPVPALFQAIRDVAAGGFAFSPRVSAAIFGGMGGRPPPAGAAENTLTDRELQVFRLTGLALPTREIADKLGVSGKTIEAHRENIKNKLGVDTHAALVARAAQWIQEVGR
jgi:DNA-binding NarL/FixJ family response regulator